MIVEDEVLLGIQIEEDLRAAGYETLGPFTTLGAAQQAARREEFDLAVLDVNLNDQKVFPVADALREAGIPVILMSGYSTADLPNPYRGLPRLSKPFDPSTMVNTIRRTLQV